MVFGCQLMNPGLAGSRAYASTNNNEQYWVIRDTHDPADITLSNNILTLNNGLVERKIDLNQNGTTTSFRNIYRDWELLSGMTVEGIVGLDGTNYEIGGTSPHAFQYESYTITDTTDADFAWEPSHYTAKTNPWPALGKGVEITYTPPSTIPDQYKNVKVKLRYEIFTGIPVISKRGFVTLGEEDASISITYFATDKLAVSSEHTEDIYVETNYNGGGDLNQYRNKSYQWDNNTITVQFDMGPDYTISRTDANDKNDYFRGFRAYELLHSVPYYEQKQIEVQNMYKIIAPWVLDAPIYMHLISDDSAKVKETVDSLASVGFDIISQTFGSGFNITSTDPNYIQRKSEDFQYAADNGIEIGGYTLAVIKDYGPIGDPNIATNGDPNKITRCMSTDWAYGYYNNILNFMNQTGANTIAVDGSWHFYTCSAQESNLPAHHHKGLDDSRYQQWLDFSEGFLGDLKDNDVYVHAPDWMFLNGANKAGIGYEEIGWSQPRHEQLIIGRQYNYRGTFLKLPSMAWSFLPIMEYKGGGDLATFEPLDQNAKDYEWAIAQAFAAGVQPTFRGQRIFSNDYQKDVVAYWVKHFKRYRELLNSNTIHVKYPEKDTANPLRTTGMDVIMHADATVQGVEKGYIMVFNQTDQPRVETIQVPLYYTGLTGLTEPPMPVPDSSPGDCQLPVYGQWPPPYHEEPNDEPSQYPAVTGTIGTVDIHQEGNVQGQNVTIDSNGNAFIEVSLEPMSYTWYTITASGDVVAEPYPYPNLSSTNILQGKLPTSGSTPIAFGRDYNKATDGDKVTTIWTETTKGQPSILTYDLGEVYNITDFNMWHYYGDNRQYHDVTVTVSNDPTYADSSTVIVFNNDSDNSLGYGSGTDLEYAETQEGKLIKMPQPVQGRYVRFTINGNSVNDGNQIVELEVMVEN